MARFRKTIPLSLDRNRFSAEFEIDARAERRGGKASRRKDANHAEERATSYSVIITPAIPRRARETTIAIDEHSSAPRRTRKKPFVIDTMRDAGAKGEGFVGKILTRRKPCVSVLECRLSHKIRTQTLVAQHLGKGLSWASVTAQNGEILGEN